MIFPVMWVGFVLIAIICIVAGIWSYNYGINTKLTKQGRNSMSEIDGLARYMCDFSDFSERGLTDMVVWDRYLVYAAAFGLTKTLTKNLQQVLDNIPVEHNDRVVDLLHNYYDHSLLWWMWMPTYHHFGGADMIGVNGLDLRNTVMMNFDFTSVSGSLTASINSMSNTIGVAFGSGGASGVGGFGGVGGGVGGGSFGGR